jgi:hypothetical protein
MTNYSKKALQTMESIIEAAEEGITFELPSKKAAINMRQRIYNYRNRINRGNDEQQKALVNRVEVRVVQDMVQVTLKEEDYMDEIRSQLDGKEEESR